MSDRRERDGWVAGRPPEASMRGAGGKVGRIGGGDSIPPEHRAEYARMVADQRLLEAIEGERRDWHEVSVRPDDIAAVLAENARLRRQNHEAAERHDRDKAELQSRVGRYESAFARARELVRGSPVDWTNDPPSQEENGWWKYTSVQNRNVIAAAVHDGVAENARLRALDHVVEDVIADLDVAIRHPADLPLNVLSVRQRLGEARAALRGPS